jgi:hypothetical protein
MKINLIILIAFLIFSVKLFAGAWTQKIYKGYFQLSTQLVSADKAYDSEGKKYSIPNFSDITINFYGEYGLTNDFSVLMNLPFYRILKFDGFPQDEKRVSKTGISDSHLGLKIKLAEFSQNVLSVSALLGIPLGKRDEKNGLWTGSEEWNQILMVNFGRSFYPLNFYTSSSIGFNNRTNGFSDEIRYSFEGGYFVVKNKLLLILRLAGIASLKNGSLNNAGGVAGLYSNNQNFLAYGPEVHYSINESIGVIAKFESAAMVKNAPSAIAYSIGIFLKN